MSLTFKISLCLLFIALVSAIEDGSHFCPPSNLFPSQCQCDPYDRAINCFLYQEKEKQVFDIKKSLEKVGKHIQSSGHPASYFSEFFLMCTSKVKTTVNLPEKTFGFLMFRKITIDKCNVDSIHPNAFGGSPMMTEYFNMRGNTIQPMAVNSLLKAITNMPTLRSIDLSYNNIETIPSNAFKALKNLTDLDLQGNDIKSIGDFAFAELSSLDLLNLDHNEISSIKANSFACQGSRNFRLVISLNSNRLNSSSFENDCFASCKRPMLIEMDGNILNYLDENVFKSFLLTSKRNALHVRGNPIECIDKNNWIKKYEIQLQYLLQLEITGSYWECKTPKA
ncbi:protein slit-like protein [Dinothrombium tinctorium]|uniref:Protein slit-like protein n=1 Tax=Dinothrombium tinctorium TaxID=1965070 RepID=A0A3S3RVJ9_9ACAR|nr:protein slit-like protein [Dinothrombium tinctorium]RWS06670.1 protein slit-like protein [Dinothrombium tinctorium]RWS06672.1 protein slit-like protein [Dinothrombium tinctorium]